MKRRILIPAPELEQSFVERLEYGLTSALVLVVIVALLEILGVNTGLGG